MVRKHNPERSAWKGRSYKKGGRRVRELREAAESAPESLGSEEARAERQAPEEADRAESSARGTPTEDNASDCWLLQSGGEDDHA